MIEFDSFKLELQELVWKDYELSYEPSSDSELRSIASNSLVHYKIYQIHSSTVFEVYFNLNKLESLFKSLEDAKAFVQSDYYERIRSCIKGFSIGLNWYSLNTSNGEVELYADTVYGRYLISKDETSQFRFTLTIPAKNFGDEEGFIETKAHADFISKLKQVALEDYIRRWNSGYSFNVETKIWI